MNATMRKERLEARVTRDQKKLFQQAANFLVGGIFASVAVFTAFIFVLLAFPDGFAGASTQRRV